MALIKIPKEMGSTPGIVDNSNATAITIDSSENLTLSGSTVVLNNAGGDAQMYFGGTSGTNRMYLARSGSDSLLWNVSNGLMKFGVNNQEALRLTAARDMYFGSFSGDAAHVGHIMQANGALYNTRDQGTVQYLRRLTTDGAIVEFNKDTSLVGSIGTAGGDLTVNAASLGVLQVGGASKYGWNGSFIYPTNDNARDLGTSNFRFKDLYLSGGVSVTTAVENGTAQFKTLNANPATPQEQFYVGNNLQHVDLGNKRGDLKFFTGTTEKMRLDSSGNLLVGTTSGSTKLTVQGTGTGDIQTVLSGSTANTNVGMIVFRDGASDYCGQITSNGATNTVSYVSASDQRLKENIEDADDAGSKIDAIQVRQYDWKKSNIHQDYGVIAQELAEVAPEAVHQPEDLEEMMGVDYSKLVPMLIKEIQSLRNRVAQLEE